MADLLRIQDILSKIQAYRSDADVDLIQKAYVFAAQAHDGQVRRSGEPYVLHPLAVAELVAELQLDEAAICAAILHDTVEDTSTTVGEVEELFGTPIAQLVDGLTKLSKIRFNSSQERQAENFRKMIIAMSRDLRVILVKLADRLHNMRTLHHLPEEKQKRISQETLDIYAPLANRLGVNAYKQELEDLSFRYIWPGEYRFLAEKVSQTRDARETYTSDVTTKINELMDSYELDASITGRPKHLYSIWQKMRRQGIDFEHVYDLIGFRIITGTEKDCYQSLGLIHMNWRPIPGRFKDYIALPKANNYRSLHTAVIGPNGQRIEVQIRTGEMHQVNEHGVAAHWAYKEGRKKEENTDQKFIWLKQLVQWQRELKDPEDFLDTLKLDLFVDDVYAFTPNGDLKVLPRGSTAVDFAYAIHSEVGDHCCGALVNGRMVPLDYRLRNGDMVDIRNRDNQNPNPDWLRFVRTGRAKNRIRAHQRKIQRIVNLDLGRELLEKELRRYGKSLNKVTKTKTIEKAVRALGFQKKEDLLAAIGAQRIQASSTIRYILTTEEREAADAQDGKTGDSDGGNLGIVERLAETFRRRLSKQRSGIKVDGMSDILVRTAKCCQPVPGDRITGYVTTTQGVSIHAIDCPNIKTADPERMVETYWDHQNTEPYPTWVRVISENTHGKLADMSQVFSQKKINILNAACNASRTDMAVSDFEIVVQDSEQLELAIASLRRLPGVVSVERLRPS